MRDKPAWLDTIDRLTIERNRYRDALIDIEALTSSKVHDPKSTYSQIIVSVQYIAESALNGER